MALPPKHCHEVISTEYEYIDFYELSDIGPPSIGFLVELEVTVLAYQNAHILLAECDDLDIEQDFVYEIGNPFFVRLYILYLLLVIIIFIVIGGDNNTISAIRRKCDKETIKQEPTPGILKCDNTYTTFVITIELCTYLMLILI